MQCKDCRASVIGGGIPDYLLASGRCQRCYPSYLAEQQLKNNAESIIEQKQKKVEEQEARDEEIENRFDILDM